MKTMNVSPLSFGQVYVQEPVNKFQRRKANNLAKQIKELRKYNTLDEAGIDVNIKVSPDRGKFLNRNLLSVYFTQGKVNEFSNFWFKKDKEIFEESGDTKKLLNKVKDFANEVETTNWDISRRINSKEAKELLKNLDSKQIVVWKKGLGMEGRIWE